MMLRRLLPLLALAALALPAPPLRAETAEVRFAEGFGLSYLPITVMVEEKLIEGRAAALGLGPVKASLVKISGGPGMIDALLSGSLDFISGGVPPMINLWDKTRGTLNVKAIASLGDSPMLLNTIDPEIRSLADFAGRGKIAVPAVRISVQALTLQMAAEKQFGPGNHARLDASTVSMPHPEAMQALTSGSTEVTAHFAIMPFVWEQAKNPKIRTILNSYDVLGGPHTGAVLYNTGRWKEANPRTFLAVAAALDDAMALINADPGRAAAIYVKVNGARTPAGEIEKMLTDPRFFTFTTRPDRVMPYVAFMHRQGQIKTMPASWTELFWENLHGQAGS